MVASQAKPTEVLLVDADDDLRRQVIDILSDSAVHFKVTEAGDRSTLEDIFNNRTTEFNYDVVISEMTFPKIINFDPIGLVQSRDPTVPIIILTSNHSIKAVIKACKVGVSDYILKSSRNLKRLPEIITSVKDFRNRLGGFSNGEKAEEQLRSYADEIVRKNQALAEARDRALEASRLKSEYLAMMGHEIRTPMNAMTGMTELLLDTPLNQEQHDYVEILRDSSQVLLTLINDILDFSKIEAGKLALENIEFNPLELAESAIDVFATNARKKNIELMVYISAQVPVLLKGDPMRLRQVLNNLISNAVKFTEAGEIEVRVDLLEETEKYVMLLFQVRDTGIGLSEESQLYLFQPYTQAEESTSRKYGGSGLGLAISKRLVNLMDGEISVSSVLGKGATFWFTATFEKCNLPEIKPVWKSDFGTIGQTVLVADENRTNREIIKQYLEILEMQVDEAGDSIEALQALTSAAQTGEPYQFAIIGLNPPRNEDSPMPPEIVQMASLPSTYTILMVPLDHRGLGENAVDLGISTYLLKPIKRNHLLETIHNLKAGKIPLDKKKEGTLPSVSTSANILLPEVKTPKAAVKRPVMLVEDNSTNLRLATLQLQKLGYSVEAFGSSKKALEAVIQNSGKYHAILMDLQMPEMDGYETTRQIRVFEEDKGFHTPIIAMTASTIDRDHEACIEAGMDDVITKPVMLATLHKVLQNWGMHKYRSMTQTKQLEGWPEISPLIDSDILRDIISMQTPDEPDILIELINIYLIDSKKYFENITQSANSDDIDALKKAIHSLKGASGNIGARFLAARCEELEGLLEKNNIEKVKELLSQVELEFNQVCSVLIDYREKRKQASEI